MNTEIPQEIKYLEPFISYLQQLEPEEIDESVDTSLLIDGINEKLNKLNPTKSLKTLNNDMLILNNWIEKQNQPHPAIFITSFVQLDKEFVRFIKEQNTMTNIKSSKKSKKVKFSAVALDGFEQDKYKDAIIYNMVKDNSFLCTINLEIIGPNLSKLLSSIEDHIETNEAVIAGTDVHIFNHGNAENYKFTKFGHQFLLSVESLESMDLTDEIALIIDSLEIHK